VEVILNEGLLNKITNFTSSVDMSVASSFIIVHRLFYVSNLSRGF